MGLVFEVLFLGKELLVVVDSWEELSYFFFWVRFLVDCLSGGFIFRYLWSVLIGFTELLRNEYMRLRGRYSGSGFSGVEEENSCGKDILFLLMNFLKNK